MLTATLFLEVVLVYTLARYGLGVVRTSTPCYVGMWPAYGSQGAAQVYHCV